MRRKPVIKEEERELKKPAVMPHLVQRFTVVCLVLIWGCAHVAQAAEASFVENNGIVAFETESIDVVSPWAKESSVPGYSGTGYFIGTVDYFSQGGLGTVSYPVKINTAGRYQIQWRSRIAEGTSSTDCNDSYARLTDAYGNPVTPVTNDNEPTGSWYKLYMNHLGGWSWQTSNHDNNPRSLSWNLQADTLYYLEISVRSDGHAVDRIVLWDHNRQNLGDRATGQTSGYDSALDAVPSSTFQESTAPSVTLLSPAQGASAAAPASFQLTATASDPNGTIAQVEFFSGTTSLGVDTMAPFEADFNGAAEGVHELSAVATDNDGEQAVSETVSVVAYVTSAPAGVVSGGLMQWHKVTVTFEGPDLSESAVLNPFTDYRLDVAFRHTDSGTTYIIPGYYAADGNAAESSASGGNKWQVHFMPDRTGEWTYTASFRYGKDVSVSTNLGAGSTAGYFDTDSGTFSVSGSDKSGVDFRAPDKGKLLYTGEHALNWSGSSNYFFKVGMNHPEVFLEYNDFDNTPSGRSLSAHQIDAKAGDPTWKNGKGSEILGVVNYLSNQGMNVQYFLVMNLQGDGKEAYPYTGSPADENVLRFDVSKLAQWGRVFDHMMTKGVMPHIVLCEQENQSLHEFVDPSSTTFADNRKLLYREMVARFGHLNAVTWNIGEENGWQKDEFYGKACTTQQRKDFAAYLDGLLAYRDHIVVHNGPGTDDHIYTDLVGDPSFTGAAYQWELKSPGNAFNRMSERRSQSEAAGQKWVVTYDEPFVVGLPAQDEWRKNAMWLSIAAGCAGAEIYSGQDTGLQDWRTFSAFYPDMKRAKDFLIDYEIPFWRMTPDTSLVSDGYALATEGEVYLIYLPEGGSTTLDLTGQTGGYTVSWFDPRNGGALQQGLVSTVTGGGVVSLGNPLSGAYLDWVVLVRKIEFGAVISADPIRGAVPLEVDFDAGLSIGSNDAPIVSYEWDFDNNGTTDATGVAATHTYPNDGTYTVKLTVTDNLGATYDTTLVIDAILQQPYGNGGAPWPVPGRVEVEYFDVGGEGISYHDTTGNNEGGAGRTDENVDVGSVTDVSGNQYIGWVENGEWLEYSVDVSQGGTYQIITRFALAESGGDFRILVDGDDVTGTLSLPATGDAQNWVDIVSAEFELQSGEKTVRVEALSDGFNLNWIEFVPVVRRFKSFVAGYPSLTGNNTLPAADPDLDGIPNVVEQWLGLNPTVDDKALESYGIVQENGSIYFQMQHDNSFRDSSYTVYLSIDLQNWYPIAVNPAWITNLGDKTRIRVPAGQNVTNLFYRLDLTLGAAYSATSNVAPTVSFAIPAADLSNVKGGSSVSFLASASDEDGEIDHVVLYKDGSLVETKTTNPYLFSSGILSAGTYSFTLIATDDQGATSAVATRTVAVDDNLGKLFMAVDFDVESNPGNNFIVRIMTDPSKIGYLGANSWVAFNSFDFGQGATSVVIQASTENTTYSGAIQLRLDSPTGPLIGSVDINGTTGWNTFGSSTATISGATGVHNLYLVFPGGCDVQSFMFNPIQKETIVVDAVDFAAESHPGDDWNVRIMSNPSKLGYLWNGTWAAYDVDFGSGISSFTINAGSPGGSSIDLRLGSPTGTVIGTVTIGDTKDYNLFEPFTTSSISSSATGEQTLYLMFSGKCDVQSFEFQ